MTNPLVPEDPYNDEVDEIDDSDLKAASDFFDSLEQMAEEEEEDPNDYVIEYECKFCGGTKIHPHFEANKIPCPQCKED